MLSDNNTEEDDDSEDGSKRKITVVAHNFQGYNSYFLLQEYHRQARDLTQIVNGGKVLELKVGKTDKEKIRFIDYVFFTYGLGHLYLYVRVQQGR